MDETGDEIGFAVGLNYNPDLEPAVWLKQPGTYLGERRLLVALISDAIEAVRAPVVEGEGERANRARQRQREARLWFAGKLGPKDDLFSYASCCEGLGLDPGWLLKGIRQMKARPKKRNQYTERKVKVAA